MKNKLINKIIKKIIYLLIILGIFIFMIFETKEYLYSYRNIGKIEDLPKNIQEKININYFEKNIKNLGYDIKYEVGYFNHCEFGEITYANLYLPKSKKPILKLKFSNYKKVFSEILGVEKEGKYLIIKEYLYNYGTSIAGCSTENSSPYYYGPKFGISVVDLDKNKVIFRQILKDFGASYDINYSDYVTTIFNGNNSILNRCDIKKLEKNNEGKEVIEFCKILNNYKNNRFGMKIINNNKIGKK